ncbi:hypothetical protein ATANTOWER_020997 [Ataeniobius toweri]|uniref:Uncharacterized protein n=1 Tax=Ataeniobius toweri TaxID=208326 RepID=A0ABU7A373_9TELE|nr:hypothetical protein [Ataeniobius toweri]
MFYSNCFFHKKLPRMRSREALNYPAFCFVHKMNVAGSLPVFGSQDSPFALPTTREPHIFKWTRVRFFRLNRRSKEPSHLPKQSKLSKEINSGPLKMGQNLSGVKASD